MYIFPDFAFLTDSAILISQASEFGISFDPSSPNRRKSQPEHRHDKSIVVLFTRFPFLCVLVFIVLLLFGFVQFPNTAILRSEARLRNPLQKLSALRWQPRIPTSSAGRAGFVHPVGCTWRDWVLWICFPSYSHPMCLNVCISAAKSSVASGLIPSLFFWNAAQICLPNVLFFSIFPKNGEFHPSFRTSIK